MINRALTISTIAIFFLLSLQAVWLFRIIENEKITFSKQAEQTLKEAVNRELNSRMNSFNKKNDYRVTISNNLPTSSAANQNENIKTFDIGSRDNKGIMMKVTLEEAFQEVYRNINPLNIDTLSAYYAGMLAKAGKPTHFILTYKDAKSAKSKTAEFNEGNTSLLFFHPFFETSMSLSVSKELMLNAKIFYPKAVLKGDLLSILILSLALTVFILISIIMQTRMFYKQVSLAKLKENITHFLTHELRSPLQASITNLEVGEMADSKTAPYFLGKAKEQLYFLNGLIDNILDINKFEKRQAPLNKEIFNINEAIEPHIARHNVDSKKSVTITTNITPGENLYGDKLHISNAIGNLIDNAIKYSNDQVNIHITAKQEGKFYSVAVEDNGIGIPKEEQSKVFEKFYRVSKREHSQKGKGFGLGLNYVMWVVKSHKGKIQLSSEVGLGSKFTLLLMNNEHGKENSASR